MKKIYTYDYCYEKALKYHSAKDFRESCYGAWDVASRNGWIKDYTWFKKRTAWNKKWTLEKIEEIARNYETLNDFRKGNPQAYGAYYKQPVRFDFFNRKPSPFRDKMDNVYAYFFVEQNAVYVGRTVYPKTRNTEHHKKGGVFKYASANNVEIPQMTILESGLSLDDGCEREDYYVNKYRSEGWNIINKGKTGKKSGSIGGIGHKWNYDKVKEIALGYEYKCDFQKQEPKAYNYAWRHNFLKDFDWLKYKKAPKNYYSFEKCREIAMRYDNLKDFRTKEESAYTVALDNDWVKEFTWLKRVGSEFGYWNNYERCREAALKCKTRDEFCRKYFSAMKYSRKNGWLESFEWLLTNKPKGYWNYENCRTAALECKTRYQFHMRYAQGYIVSLNNGWIDDFFPKAA